MANAFRSELAAGIETIATAFITANPTMLRKFFRSRPDHFAQPGPIGYIGGRPETVTFDQGTFTREVTPSIVLVGPSLTSVASTDALDDLVDAFVFFLGGFPHIVTGTIWSRLSINDGREETGDGGSFPNTTITILNLTKQTGRTTGS